MYIEFLYIIVNIVLRIERINEKKRKYDDFSLSLSQRLNERDLEERGDYMDRRRELQENFELVVSSNQKMAEDITSELKEIWQNIALKSEKRIQNEVHGPLAEEFLQKCIWIREKELIRILVSAMVSLSHTHA